MGTVQGEHHEVFRICLPVCCCLRCSGSRRRCRSRPRSPVQQPGLRRLHRLCRLPPSLHLWRLRPLRCCCACCPFRCCQERGGDPRRGEDHCPRCPRRDLQRCPSRLPRRVQHRRRSRGSEGRLLRQLWRRCPHCQER